MAVPRILVASAFTAGDFPSADSNVLPGRDRKNWSEVASFNFVRRAEPRKLRAGNEGLTNHSPRDLYGTVAPLQNVVAEDAGKDQESLSGSLRAEPSRFSGDAEGSAEVSILVGKRVRRFAHMLRRRSDMNEAYTEVLERQARRGLGMLPDRAGNVERIQHDFERRQALAIAFGDWIANSQGPWDWFINPISFRDLHPDMERNPTTGEPRQYRATGRVGPIRTYVPDPRLKSWEPDFRGRRNSGPPVPDKALAEVKDWLFELQSEAGQPIRWMIAEEFGEIGGRYHCHSLVAGVAHLRRDIWWEKAFVRFGRTKISIFDPKLGGAFYAAKYAAKRLGALHFGGSAPGAEFSAQLSAGQSVGCEDVLQSAEMSRDEIRRWQLFPRGCPGWRSER